MATLRVTSLRGRTAGTSPELPDGAVVTGVTTTVTVAVVGAIHLQSMLVVLMLVLVITNYIQLYLVKV